MYALPFLTYLFFNWVYHVNLGYVWIDWFQIGEIDNCFDAYVNLNKVKVLDLQKKKNKGFGYHLNWWKFWIR